jgi:hypothetical protein
MTNHQRSITLGDLDAIDDRVWFDQDLPRT